MDDSLVTPIRLSLFSRAKPDCFCEFTTVNRGKSEEDADYAMKVMNIAHAASACAEQNVNAQHAGRTGGAVAHC